MKCLQCGRCCFYNVIIVKPETVKDDLDTDTLTEDDLMALDGTEKCPHLTWVGRQAICEIHHHVWFPDTPCGQYRQEVEKSVHSSCRVGVYMLDSKNENTWRHITLRTRKDEIKTIEKHR